MNLNDRRKLISRLEALEEKAGLHLSGGIQYLTEDDLKKYVEKMEEKILSNT
jgi:hypothetical protein